MKDGFITIATFSTPWEARLAKITLEAAGVDAVLFDENFIGVNPLLTNALGWIKLQVPASEEETALLLLSNSSQELPQDDEDVDYEVNDAEAEAPLGDSAALNSREQLVRGAFRGALLGLVIHPLQLYVFYLLIRIRISREPLRASLRWRAILTAIINLPIILVFVFFLGRMMG